MIKPCKPASFLALLSPFVVFSQCLGACIPIRGNTDPVTITAPGHYCLMNDIVSSSGKAGILVQADNVVIDFAGHTLSNAASITNLTPPGLIFGVDASYNKSVSIMNGTIKGFTDGIVLGEKVTPPNPGNYYVANMKILNTQSLGRAVGIYEATGSNVTIVGNVISYVTGGVPGVTSGDAFGLMIYGATDTISQPGNIIIKGNQVDHVTAVTGGGDAAGILVNGDKEILVGGNVVKEVSVVPFPPFHQMAYGITVTDVSQGLVDLSGNYVWNSTAASNSIGILLSVFSAQDSATLRYSVVGGFNTGISINGECTPNYFNNAIFGAATTYAITSTPNSCL